MKGIPTFLNVKKFCKFLLLILNIFGYDGWSHHIDNEICHVHPHKAQCLREMGKICFNTEVHKKQY